MKMHPEKVSLPERLCRVPCLHREAGINNDHILLVQLLVSSIEFVESMQRQLASILCI